jgi:hypothetical protein
VTAYAYADEEPLPEIHPSVLATDQIIEAVQHLNRHPDSLVRWPFPDLDALTGPMGAGEVWFVPAFSGGGKTTFVVSAIEAWRLMGKRIYVMPLELQPFRFRTMLACMATGTHPGDALSGQLRADPLRKLEREALKEALIAQSSDEYVRQVRVSGQRAIDVRGLERGLQEAKAFDADVVIVDHIDHIEGDQRTSLYAASKQVNHAALRMAQDNGLLLVFTSQLNMEIARGDRLAKYAAPMVQQVQFPSVKLQVATGMIGLYRPLRDLHDGETPEDYASALKRARTGDEDTPDMLAPNTMGVVSMKSRNYGSREGTKIRLSVERGRVLHLPEKDRHQTTYDGVRRV